MSQTWFIFTAHATPAVLLKEERRPNARERQKLNLVQTVHVEHGYFGLPSNNPTKVHDLRDQKYAVSYKKEVQFHF